MMSTQAAADLMQGQHHGQSVDFNSVEIDSRRLEAGGLFVAIRGDKQDGHQFIPAAIENGAVAALVDTQVPVEALTQIQVKDTTLGLGKLAAAWRARFAIPVVGVTGSNGKTTVSAMLRAIFDEALPGIAPDGSFNNHWGVPLTLLKIREHSQSAVIEMGMNHPGELSYLTDIVRPDVAVINNAAAAHLEGLVSVEGVAKAKAEIIQGVPTDGTVVLNADDQFFPLWQSLCGERRLVTFGLNSSADVYASGVSTERGTVFQLHMGSSQAEVKLSLLGKHNVMNALAAAAAASAAGVGIKAIQAGLAQVAAVKGRLVMTPGPLGSSLIDDTYNANPASIKAGLQVLSDCVGTRIAVLGKMAELGDDASAQHQHIGRLARELGLERLIAVGAGSEAYVSGFGAGAEHVQDIAGARDMIAQELSEDVTVLIKGSRAAGMEGLVEQLQVIDKKEAATC